MMIIIVLLLVSIIIGLMFYNMSIHKKIDSFKNINQQIKSLNVLQDFMDTISETSSVDDKLKKINDILKKDLYIPQEIINIIDLQMEEK